MQCVCVCVRERERERGVGEKEGGIETDYAVCVKEGVGEKEGERGGTRERRGD